MIKKIDKVIIFNLVSKYRLVAIKNLLEFCSIRMILLRGYWSQ